MSSLSPIDLLRTLDSRAKRLTRPAQAGGVSSWQAMTVLVGEQEMLVPASDIAEVIDAPTSTRVPGTHEWFLGLGNLRGQVLPITDLGRFLFGVRGFRSAQHRVLVHGHGETVVGFSVGELRALRQFTSEIEASTASVPESLKPFVKGVAVQGEQSWPVLSLQAVASSDAFLQVAFEL